MPQTHQPAPRQRRCRVVIANVLSLIVLGLTPAACVHSSADDAVQRDILHGTISYPFVQTRPLGINSSKEKFIIRSINDGSETVVEIPGAGEDYDIELPLGLQGGGSGGGSAGARPKSLPSPAATDREVVANLPDAANQDPTKSAFVDKAFGVGKGSGPQQSPSYMLGIAKINDLYRERTYEYALIEINHLLAFYPNSPQLHKMKGTIYVKMQNYALAEKSWITALELTPHDKVLRVGLQRLQAKIKTLNETGQGSASIPAAVSPGGPQATAVSQPLIAPLPQTKLITPPPPAANSPAANAANAGQIEEAEITEGSDENGNSETDADF